VGPDIATLHSEVPKVHAIHKIEVRERDGVGGHIRVVGTVFLLAVSAFCIFGFLASFELAGVTVFHIIYSTVGVASLIGAGCLATQPAKTSSDH
jgi:hypothetical protein